MSRYEIEVMVGTVRVTVEADNADEAMDKAVDEIYMNRDDYFDNATWSATELAS